jgi:hypothetical protein
MGEDHSYDESSGIPGPHMHVGVAARSRRAATPNLMCRALAWR